MRIFFLGSFFPKEAEDSIRKYSKGPIANANNALQWSYICGLVQHYPSLEVITLPQIGAFPRRYKKLFFKSDSPYFGIQNNMHGHIVDFFNLIGFKHFHRYFQAKAALTELIQQSSDKEIIIIVYDLHPPFIKAVKKCKKTYNKIKICSIVPDLPFMTGSPDNFLQKIFARIENIFLKKSFDAIDLFVFLSMHMAGKLPVSGKPWIVIEGMYNADDDIVNEVKKNPGKILFYSGAVNERNGIFNLIEAFNLIPDDDYRLIICGDGDAKNYVLDSSRKNSRIIYKGQISRTEVLALQKESTLLINPRTSDEEFSKFSFPSKTLEYFASGVPVLMFHIEGIPEEYYSFCYTVKENTPVAMKEMIMMICETDPIVLKFVGERARNFILNDKNPFYQCSKLAKFINEKSSSN